MIQAMDARQAEAILYKQEIRQVYLAGLDLQFLRSEQVWAALPGNAEKENKTTR